MLYTVNKVLFERTGTLPYLYPKHWHFFLLLSRAGNKTEKSGYKPSILSVDTLFQCLFTPLYLRMLHPGRQSSALLCAVLPPPASGWLLLLSFTLAGARLSWKMALKALRPPMLQSLPAKAHSTACSSESPWLSSLDLLCLASAEASLHTRIPSRSLPLAPGLRIGDFSCVWHFLTWSSRFKPWQILPVVCVWRHLFR